MIDFAAINRAAVARLPELVQGWIPGGAFEGDEYVVRNPKRNDLSPGSFKINVRTGKWGDFAAQIGGGDPIGLWAFLDDVKQSEAAQRLAQRLGIDAGRSGESKRPIVPVPADATDPRKWRHPKYGSPVAGWPYYDAHSQLIGYVVRLEYIDGRGRPAKDYLPLTFCDVTFKNGTTGRAWRSAGFPEPRPLYRLPWLLAAPDVPVIITEGEKCADAVGRLFSGYIGITPAHGAKSPHRTDWTSCRGRSCIIWPDHDEPGRQFADRVARLLHDAGAASIAIVDVPETFPAKWDLADAAPEGADLAGLVVAAKTWTPNIIQFPGADDRDGSTRRSDWLSECQTGSGDMPLNNVANAALGLRRDSSLTGCVAYDAFAETVMLMRPLPRPYEAAQKEDEDEFEQRPWRDSDTERVQEWLQIVGLNTLSRINTETAVNLVALENEFDPVKEWIEAQVRDGQGHIGTWAIDCLGCDDTPYTRAVSRYWIIAAVARVYAPGCKFDYCPVLQDEEQGTSKSSALRTLFEPWFSDSIPADLTGKDAKQHLRGKWCCEFGELHALHKSHLDAVKVFLAAQYDDYRPSYGRRDQRFARRCIFAGTTNRTVFLTDPTGNRRSWPLRTREIDLAKLRSIRGALFAEALALYRGGERWWPVRAEERSLFKPEQDERFEADAIEPLVTEYLRQQTKTTLWRIMVDALGYEKARMPRSDQNRVIEVLERQGWIRGTREKDGRPWIAPPDWPGRRSVNSGDR
jgi:putative DNA primase/helicase